MHAEGIGFVVAAYVAAWLAMVGYQVWLYAVLRRAREEYDRAGGSK
jgi:hypothetical protein